MLSETIFHDSGDSVDPRTPLSQTLIPYFAKSISDRQIEIEWIYGSHPINDTLQKSDFLRLLKRLRSDFPFSGELNSLDIRRQYINRQGRKGIGNVRCTIEGVSDIRTYCKENSIEGLRNVTFLKKQLYKDPKRSIDAYKRIIDTDYNFRINMKKEIELSEEDRDVVLFRRDLRESLKSYRYKKRYSFRTVDGLFRIDLTALKECPYDRSTRMSQVFRSFADANLLKMKETFELEVEYVGSDETKGGYPIDHYIKSIKSKSKVSDHFQSGSKPHYFNIFSELANVEYEAIEKKAMPAPFGEFDGEMILLEYRDRLFPTKAEIITLDPEEDISYKYWDESGYEPLLDLISDTGRHLYFKRIEYHTKGSYENAPLTDYAIFEITPPLTKEDREKYLNENDTISVPLTEISDTSVSKDLTEPITVELQEGLAKYSDYLTFRDQIIESNQEELSESVRSAKLIVEAVIDRFASIIVPLLQEIRQTKRLLKKSTQDRILGNYYRLTNQDVDTSNKYKRRGRFIGPNPVPITRNELNPENPHTIYHGYAVTEKADGIRAELYIDTIGEAYLITQKLKVISTGWVFQDITEEWLFDGEYITEDKNGAPIDLYMIFDIYYGGGDGEVFKLPWKRLPTTQSEEPIQSRTDALEHFRSIYDAIQDENHSDDIMAIGFKKYYEGPDSLKRSKKSNEYLNLKIIAKHSRKILENDQGGDGFGYRVDGLIYLPLYYPVGASSEGSQAIMNGPWPVNYKWKPPEENTIDFEVTFVKERYQGVLRDKIISVTGPDGTEVCKQVSLHVLYDMKRDPNYDYTAQILFKSNQKPIQTIPFQDGPSLCNIPLTHGKLLCKRDKTQISDSMIIEMSYDSSRPEGSQWVPLRHRWDKVKPQLFLHANQIWTTIQNPVSEGMIQGTEIVEIDMTQMPTDDSYYLKDSRTKTRDQSLRVFHNYVKDKLIQCATSIQKKKISIMDTSIGRGGDIQKYLRASDTLEFLLALDLSSDVNIAAKRYYNERLQSSRNNHALFIQYDTGASIKSGSGCRGPHEDRNKQLIDILYGKDKNIGRDLRKIIPLYKNLATKGFDVISSQFSFHYYLKNEDIFRSYLQNLSDNCKPHGYFIGTCYDGMKVFKTLEATENKTIEMLDELGNCVYRIEGAYDDDIGDFHYEADQKSKCFGQKIDVYMNSIGHTISEYLVNFEMVIDIMKEYHFRLATPKSKACSQIFDTKEHTYKQGLGGFEQILASLQNRSSHDQSLKNYYKEALDLIRPENEELRTLTNLNNWFIFEKIA